MSARQPLLSVQSVSKHYRGKRNGLFSRAEPYRAVDGVSLDLVSGEIVALVGESGSGKSTLARMAANLIRPTTGQVIFDGVSHQARQRETLIQLRRNVQLIQQDASGSLDPRMSVGAQLCEIMEIHGHVARTERRSRAIALLEEVGRRPLFSSVSRIGCRAGSGSAWLSPER